MAVILLSATPISASIAAFLAASLSASATLAVERILNLAMGSGIFAVERTDPGCKAVTNADAVIGLVVALPGASGGTGRSDREGRGIRALKRDARALVKVVR